MILIRHGEIYTKSEAVRKQFIRRLVDNIREALPKIKVKSSRWRIFVEDDSNETIDILKHVFGIVSFSVVEECEADLEEIKKLIAPLLPLKGKSFAIDTKRSDKNFPLTSQQINEDLGGFVLDRQDLKVKLKNPDSKIGVEIYRGKAFVFTRSFDGPGGLPLGSAKGRVSCDFENDNDVLASWMLMKRGVVVTPLHEKLKSWGYGFTEGKSIPVKVVGVTDPSEFAIRQNQSNELLFSPLIGLGEKEISELKKRVFKE